MPEEQRLDICRTALQLAEREAEQKLVLDVLGQYPSFEGLQIIAGASLPDSLDHAAATTALQIARKVGRRKPEVRQQLAKLNLKPARIQIIKAEYGAGDKVKDVTDLVRKLNLGYATLVLSEPTYNATFGGDPTPGSPKKLTIQYTMNGKEGEVTFQENAAIILPEPK
jgi:hypothetical protein